MAKLRRSHPHVSIRDGAIVRNVNTNLAPAEPEYRGPDRPTPAPAVDMAEAFAEMCANDPEWREWRSAERLGDLFGRGGR